MQKRKHAFWGEITEILNTNKLPSRKTIALALLHQRLGQIYTKTLLAQDTANVWEYIELRIDPDSFCTSCQIS